MNFQKKISDLFKEALMHKGYKQLNICARILLIISLSPMILLFAILGLYSFLFVAFYRIFTLPSEYLNDFLVKEGKDVKHATQFIIYFIGFPVVVLSNIVIVLATISLQILYILDNCVGYIATFGGINFSPFLTDECDRFKEEDNKKYSTSLTIIIGVIGTFITGANLYNILISHQYGDFFELMRYLLLIYLFVFIPIFLNCSKIKHINQNNIQ